MTFRNPIDDVHRLETSWDPKPDVTYFVHADLAQKQDRAAIAIAHVDSWVDMGKVVDYDHIAPSVVVDFVAWWEPSKQQPINLRELGDWIISLRRRGIRLG